MATIQEERPDLVVGIDLGMTYTGVAWTNLINTTQSIDDWHGLENGHEVKVPTKLIYGPRNRVSRWGFLAEDEDNGNREETGDVHQCFKIFLDPEVIETGRRNGVREIPNSVGEAKCLIKDYLEQVYLDIKRSIESNVGPWKNKNVEFVFSTPTTWESSDITSDFLQAIQGAGFGQENSLKHRTALELTEAEAAAVYVAANPQVRFSNGDIILVCDAGGGTTDLGLIRVADSNPDCPNLKQVAAVKGVGIGSTMIDRAFQNLVQRRLDSNPNLRSTFPIDFALKLARSPTFQTVKHRFGTAAGNYPEYRLPLNRLGFEIGQNFSHPALRIEDGKMIFTRSEIQALFDTQIGGIIRRIDQQLEWMRVNRRTESVKYLVLSGGLGGSAYVHQELEQKYGSPNLSIIKSQDPRLSVVKGLIMDRRQKLRSGTAVLTTRIARASYGILCRQLYDPEIHINADVEFDFYNRSERWATNQIDWLIKKGDEINTNTAKEHEFTRRLSPGNRDRLWETTIIISHNDRRSLPWMTKHAGAFKLCVLKSDVKEVSEKEFQVKNKRFWQGRRYYLARFTIRVIVAPADLRFELWFKGVKYNRNHEPIKVEWDQVGAAARPHSRSEEEAFNSWDRSDYRLGK